MKERPLLFAVLALLFVIILCSSFKPTLHGAATTNQTCGNDDREGTEECDGLDDQQCPERCSKSCTCPPDWSRAMTEPSRHTSAYDVIEAYKTTSIDRGLQGISLQSFTFIFNTTVQKVTVIMDANISEPYPGHLPIGLAYQYFRIGLLNESQQDNFQFKQIFFRVPIIWTTNNGIRDISLQVWDDGWVSVNITKLSQDSDYVYFVTQADLGTFAVVGTKPKVKGDHAVCGNNITEAGEDSITCCADAGCSSGLSCIANLCQEAKICGNNICESSETVNSCPMDCARTLFTPALKSSFVLSVIIAAAALIFLGRKAFQKPGKIKRSAHVSPRRWF